MQAIEGFGICFNSQTVSSFFLLQCRSTSSCAHTERAQEPMPREHTLIQRLPSIQRYIVYVKCTRKFTLAVQGWPIGGS
jgi:hypothetical protein